MPPPLVVSVQLQGRSRAAQATLSLGEAPSVCCFKVLDTNSTLDTGIMALPGFGSLQTDLNGDGKPEIITATPGGRLHILAPRRFGDGFAKAEVRPARLLLLLLPLSVLLRRVGC